MQKTANSVKGIIFKGAKRWLKEELGLPKYTIFLNSVPAEDYAFWEKTGLMAMAWYPAKYYRNLYETLMALWGMKQPEIFHDAASSVAFYDLSSVMKVFMRLGTPSFVASRFPSIWRYYFSNGSFELLESSGHSIVAELKGAEAYEMAGCQGTYGWTGRALSYSGARNVHVEHTQCKFAGDDRCLFKYTWG